MLNCQSLLDADEVGPKPTFLFGEARWENIGKYEMSLLDTGHSVWNNMGIKYVC